MEVTHINEKIIIPDKVINYFKIPKDIILEKSIFEHRVMEFIYLYYNKTIEDNTHYSPTYMIQWSGYKPVWNRHNEKNIYQKYKTCMQWFFENGYLIDYDSCKYKNEIFQSSLLNMEKFNSDKDFGLLYDFEIKALKNYKSDYKPLTTSIILLVFSYIRAFTWKRINEVSGHSDKSMRRKPEICHGQITYMADYIGVSRQLFVKSIKVLAQFGFITSHKMPRFQDETGQWHTDETIFICPYKFKSTKNDGIKKCSSGEYDYQKELEYGIMFLREQKYSSKKFYQD